LNRIGLPIGQNAIDSTIFYAVLKEMLADFAGVLHTAPP